MYRKISLVCQAKMTHTISPYFGAISLFLVPKRAIFTTYTMARAKRHYIPGQIWHITHRCHKREFLLKFSKDRRRWLQWLYETSKRYGLVILNYVVTSNHIHLLVVGGDERDVIPNSIKLIAGRTGQEFNQPKSRRGALSKEILFKLRLVV